MRKEEIHLIHGDTVYQTTIITDPEIEAAVTIKKKLLSQKLSTMPKTTPEILNLSSYNSSNIQLSLFCYSTKFTWTRSGLLNYKNYLSNFTKKIQIKGIFNDTEYEDESIVRNESTRNFEAKSRELSLIIIEIENLTPHVISYKSNFTQEEYSVLQYLKGNQNIVFKTADKGGRWVITDKNYY